jgi:hypothetical protein
MKLILELVEEQVLVTQVEVVSVMEHGAQLQLVVLVARDQHLNLAQ